MGKPYQSELRDLGATYEWALQQPIDGLRRFADLASGLPLVVVGSGGSVTAAQMAALLQEDTGSLARAMTPFELAAFNKPVQRNAVLLLSAGGRNSDILSAFRLAISSEPAQLMTLCMRTGSPLAALCEQFRYCGYLGLDPPSGKDGFLATNSLLAFVILLIRAFDRPINGRTHVGFNQSIEHGDSLVDSLLCCRAVQALAKCETWIVLHGGWGLPAAVDIESKFTEAALGNVRLADYRNFGHGRHHWLAKHGSSTGVLALITPGDRSIAHKTLSLLPKNVPAFEAETNNPGPIGGLELLNKIMHLVQVVGLERGIDPGRPGVPEFGSQLYHLRASFKRTESHSEQVTLNQRESIAIQRKVSASIQEMTELEVKKCRNAFRIYYRNLTKARFGSVIFDYDGTLCDPHERLTGPARTVVKEIERIVDSGAIVGIATGRGKSVREDLKKTISGKYWDRIFIGYYNGSDIACLSNDTRPNINQDMHDRLQKLACVLNNAPHVSEVADVQYRPNQITIEPNNLRVWHTIREKVVCLLAKSGFHDLRVLESSHSIDIVAPLVSKLNLVDFCRNLAQEESRPPDVLCIGDRGKWPGNDYELLSTKFSLSVDTVSPDIYTCWNFSPTGYKGVMATLWYLSWVKVFEGMATFSPTNKRRS